MDLWNRFRGDPQDVLRWGTENRIPWRERLRSPRTLMQLGVLAGLVLATLLVIHLPQPRLSARKGDRNPILSRVYFENENPDQTAAVRRLKGMVQVPPLYTPDDLKATALATGLQGLLDEIAKAPDAERVPADIRKEWGLTQPMFEAARAAFGEKNENLPAVKERAAKAIGALGHGTGILILANEDYQRSAARPDRIRELQNKLPARVLEKDDPLMKEPTAVIDILLPQSKDGLGQTVSLRSVLPQRETALVETEVSQRIGKTMTDLFGEAGGAAVVTSVASRLGPTLVYDQTETEKRRADAAKNVDPVFDKYPPNSTIIEAGRDLTEADLKLLEKEQKAWLDSLGPWRRLLAWLGAAVIVAMLVIMLAVDTLRLQPTVGRSFPRTLMLALLVLAVVIAAKIVSQMHGPDEVNTFFLVVAAMVITVAYSQVFALALAGSMIFLVAVATHTDLDWAVTAAVGTSTAILALGEINNRTVLVRVGALSGLAFCLTRAALGFWRLTEGSVEVLGSAALYFGVGLLAGVVLLALLPYIERVFGIVTNISLLELCDVNQPALRRLALEAPGTYTHSLLIGSLAEAACEAIGANGLLARVGAYFHDIGKAVKPYYFVENWEEGENGHAGLSPQTSSQVIMNHVKDGLDMATRVSLPPIIKQFIAEHHGTTQMSYFWREAVRRQKAEGGPLPQESDYRYDGPKPRSRETALVMLADAVEGATRSQPDRSSAKVAETVRQILMNRLLDGQLDRSGLTLTDLHTAEETLTKTLLSVYHGRVPYPTGHRAGETPAPTPEKDKDATGAGSDAAGSTR
jgi:cyclic-di-AMP phosphodiesterase PgpH